MLTSKEIRQKFITFLENKGHKFVPGSPVVLQNDPTLLFTNAGMNQFKDYFLGKVVPKDKRVVNSQACIRVSGKHNDLEEVGYDTYHHTLFEMLGCWSFGDYYKKEIIVWAWELFIQVYQIPKDKLYATIYKTDDEAYKLWESETDIKHDHILRFDEKDNFWEMGDTGPCGPCSELHLDRGADHCDKQNVPHHKCRVNGGCSRYIELGNLVFIQYDRQKDGSLQELKNKHIDVGLGFERIVSYLQKTNSNYDTDLFQPIIQQIVRLTGVKYDDGLAGMPHRVMADHIRTLTFAIADNVMPSNEGRGYVLRRILRRAMRYAKNLGVQEPMMYKLVETVVQVMGKAFPNIKERKKFVQEIVLAEEKSFLSTLEKGLLIFEEIEKVLLTKKQKMISGEQAFKLYDTYGFPVDLTQLLAKEKGLDVDLVEFNAEMEQQKKRSRKYQKLGSAEDEAAARGGEAYVPQNAQEELKLARHHTCTHLLQAALREVLGVHVHQAGSLVEMDRLRFDFTHFKPLSKMELRKVEKLVNKEIQKNDNVDFLYKSLTEAKDMGAMALFGEKYALEKVRVVQIADFSMELCGGHHVKSTGEIEVFELVSETAISAGTRRIEAICGKGNIKQYFNKLKKQKIGELKRKMEKYQAVQKEIAQIDAQMAHTGNFGIIYQFLKTCQDLQTLSWEKMLKKEADILFFLKNAEKKLKLLKERKVANATQKNAFCFGDNLRKLTDEVYLCTKLFAETDGYDLTMLRNLGDDLINKNQNWIVALAAEKEGKGFFFVKLGKEVDKNKFKANEIIVQLTASAGGGGGGKAESAQAGGADPLKLEEALQKLRF
ncbi:alanine--tRNA ligase [bacterium]|nr:alanine--tRNA ligase [bacterium]